MSVDLPKRNPGDSISEMAGRAQLALIQRFGPNGIWDRYMLGEMARTVIAEMREPTITAASTPIAGAP